jgi:hypothetical protein
VIPLSIHLVSGRTAQKFNQRKTGIQSQTSRSDGDGLNVYATGMDEAYSDVFAGENDTLRLDNRWFWDESSYMPWSGPARP